MSNLRHLKVTFDSFDDLVESIGPGLSRTHLFARTDEELTEDTRVRLEIGTVRQGALIRGVAKVAGPAEETAAEPGVHLHIIHLDPSSTRLVDSIVRGEIADIGTAEKSGPSPFDIRSAEPEPAKPEPESPPEDGPPEPAASVAEAPAVMATDAADHGEQRPRRALWPLALVAAAVIFLLAIKLITDRDDHHSLLTGRDRQTESAQPARSPVDATLPQGHEPAIAETLTEPEEPVAERDPPDAGGTVEREAPDPVEAAAEQVADAVHAWADAWSRQDPEVYLELYAPDYRPPDLDRDTWKRQRRARITAPERLEVGISELDVEIIGPKRARASFPQLYTTGDKALAARKTLEWQRFETDWKIVAERLVY